MIHLSRLLGIWGLVLALAIATLHAQDLRVRVTIDAKRLNTGQATEQAIFADLEKSLNKFMNDQDWSEDNFRDGEQIQVDIVITLTESPSQNVFGGTAQVRSQRPVYGTDYNTVLLSFNDRFFNFGYTPGQPLIFNANSFTNNLTQMLAFYANLILALDYDSFALRGGDVYVERAFNILNIAQSAGEGGWTSPAQNVVSRYWLIENLQNQQMQPFREGLYLYHRQGLDILLLKPEQARTNIFKALQLMADVNKLKPASALFNVYFDGKFTEMYHVFKNAPVDMRRKVRDLLLQLDPAHAKTYDQLMQ